MQKQFSVSYEEIMPPPHEKATTGIFLPFQTLIPIFLIVHNDNNESPIAPSPLYPILSSPIGTCGGLIG